MFTLEVPMPRKAKKDSSAGEQKKDDGGTIRVNKDLARMISIIVTNRRNRMPNYSAGAYIEPMIADQVAADYAAEVDLMSQELKQGSRRKE